MNLLNCVGQCKSESKTNSIIFYFAINITNQLKISFVNISNIYEFFNKNIKKSLIFINKRN